MTGSERTSVGSLQSLIGFVVCLLIISVILSIPAAYAFDFPWWKTFRRCVSIGAAISLWLWITKIERRPLSSYGLPSIREGKRALVVGLLIGLGALSAMLAVALISGTCRMAVTSDTAKLWRIGMGFLPAALLIGVLEELVFRGFILQHLVVYSKVMGITVSSALYALVHLRTLSWDFSTTLELGGLFLLGRVLSLSYLLTQQLYLAIGLHAALAYGARVNKLLIAFSDSSISWLVGTHRLINGIVGWVTILGIGALVVWWAQAVKGGNARHGHA